MSADSKHINKQTRTYTDRDTHTAEGLLHSNHVWHIVGVDCQLWEASGHGEKLCFEAQHVSIQHHVHTHSTSTMGYTLWRHQETLHILPSPWQLMDGLAGNHFMQSAARAHLNRCAFGCKQQALSHSAHTHTPFPELLLEKPPVCFSLTKAYLYKHMIYGYMHMCVHICVCVCVCV